MTDAFAAANPPPPFDRARASRTLEELAKSGFHSKLPLLESIFGNSPFLARTALREREFLPFLLEKGPRAVLDEIIAAANAASASPDVNSVMAMLRRARRQAALAIAFADIGEIWNVDQVTRALSEFADACVGGALRFLLRQVALDVGMAEADDPAALEAETGLVILAMGKYGAFELNYSSDIDLIVFYDSERFPFRKKGDPRGAAVDLVKGLVKLLSETTVDGYVFRTDLRLRPDAGATQVAISTEAAEAYYEAMGQNWERAAMIKARACAGDAQAGAAFLKAIEPFIWRRNLDYAAIEDIHSIKRQIHAHSGHGTIAIAGHNIKLGRGGIREIEFFAQTQQLILGGRNPELRAPGTLAAIEALRGRGLVSDAAASDLTKSYRYLRKLEHRLQMVEDQQTHTLPKSQSELAHIACFMGYRDVAAFGSELRKTLETVQGHYAHLFEAEAPLSDVKGSLVFTGVENDPETLETLKSMGFRDAHHVAAAIRGWHHGRIRATRGPRARELLTKLMPALLDALSHTADPDAAFAQFDRFITRLPAGVQVFSLLLANPNLLHLIALICGSAPKLAAYLGRSPAVLDALLDPDFLHELPPQKQLRKIFAEQLKTAANYEGALDCARRFAREQIFRVGVQIIEGAAEAEEAGPALANVAETVIAGLLPEVEKELAAQSGHVKGGAFAVIAMGKLGGREMTAASDLDLIFVYDAPHNIEHSDGAKPLPVSVYYARLAQRFITALTMPTAEGGLYEVDMRLRPTGNKGPVAVSLESFARYHASEAWTWEKLALTRARIIVAPEHLAAKIAHEIRSTLIQPPDEDKLLKDAREMRAKLAAQFPGRNRWDLKFAAGGLVDLEFIAQTLQLREAHRAHEILDTNTIGALQRLAKIGALDEGDAATLIDAAKLEHALTHVLRIALDGTLDPATATPGLKALLTRAGAAADFEALEEKLATAQIAVRAIFNRVMLVE
jgi:[glutamine synthetase] adenylyltransferase / [glutamine synthetase]-adenylyl-L-tyrosine phosphorylase